MTYNMKVSARVRRIGGSLGVIIQADEAKQRGLAEGDVVELEIERKTNPRALFGKFTFSKTTQELKDEARAGWG